MGIEYALVNDDDRTFILLGKKCRTLRETGDGAHTEAVPVGFQMHDEVIARFVCAADAGSSLRMVSDETDEYDELHENNYTLVDEWCGEFASRRPGKPTP